MKIVNAVEKEEDNEEGVQEAPQVELKMFDKWLSFLVEDFENVFMSDKNKLQNREECQTCKYWKLLGDDYYRYLTALENALVEKGMEGKIHKSFDLGDGNYDSYFDSRFYGFCKRYPPVKSNGSIRTKGGLLSGKSTSVNIKMSEYNFPLMPHEEWCGEWSVCEWCSSEEKLNEYIEWAKEKILND